LIRMVHRRADLTLVTSPQILQEFVDQGIPRVDVWRKGVDTIRFHPDFKSEAMRSRMTEGNPDDFLMVYVGRLGAEKRLKDLKPILERSPNSRLCIVGAGPQEAELQRFFRGTNTVFTGQLSGDELSSAFASGDAFMMPSDSETLGFVVLESMASGVPVIGANAGGIPSIIHDGKDSFLIETGDIDGYVNKLAELKDAKYRAKIGNNARKEAERWSWEAATSVLRNIQYERALINFHSRAFGGFGRVGTKKAWRLLGWRIRRTLGNLYVPGFRRTPPIPPVPVIKQ
jgi:sulfoquinovosyltransferase